VENRRKRKKGGTQGEGKVKGEEQERLKGEKECKRNTSFS